MFLISNVSGLIPNACNAFLYRAVSCNINCRFNHYLTLGVTPNASQEDIKRKYFELCKKYHPDRNKGSAESAAMFRRITQAYETLGNEKSRQLYDQSMNYGTANYAQRWDVKRKEDYNYRAEKYSYEKRNVSASGNIHKAFTGKTWYYDFDAWTRAHYPKGTPNFRNEALNEELKSRTFKKRRQYYENLFWHPFKTLYIIVISTIGLLLIILSPDYGMGRDSYTFKITTNSDDKSQPEKLDLNNKKH